MLISAAYKELQTQFHKDRDDYGRSGHKWAEKVIGWSQQLQSREVLDYGSGKQTLQKSIPFPITNYDPCTPGYDDPPAPHDFVVCTDVLEHIEPDCLDAVLDHLQELTKKLIFLSVATRPAVKVLPDGRNAHLIQEDPDWWMPKLFCRFDIQSYQRIGDGEFVVLAFPKVKPAEPEA